MSDNAAPMKTWQHGIALDDLLRIEAIYSDYNTHSVSPFSAVKKNSIAAMLHDGRLQVLTDDANGQVAAFSATTSRVTSPITVYNDVELDRKRVGDVTLAHLAGDATRLQMAIRQHYRRDVWAVTWVDDHDKRDLLEREGFQRIGSKVTTFGEIYAIYFRDSQTAFGLFAENTRSHPTLPAAEFVNIKRIGHVGSASPLMMHAARKLSDLGLKFTNHYSNYNRDKSWSAVSLRGFSPEASFIAKPVEMNREWKKANKEAMGVVSDLPLDFDEANDNVGPAPFQGAVFAIQDTPLRSLFPEVDEALQPYGDQFERIRFMQLAPGGGELDRHTDQVDPDTGVRIGNNARIHIPIVTNNKVEFTSWDLENKPTVVNMHPGEVWYLDTRKPHRAINGGETARIHLVVDVIVTPRFQALLEGT